METLWLGPEKDPVLKWLLNSSLRCFPLFLLSFPISRASNGFGISAVHFLESVNYLLDGHICLQAGAPSVPAAGGGGAGRPGPCLAPSSLEVSFSPQASGMSTSCHLPATLWAVPGPFPSSLNC